MRSKVRFMCRSNLLLLGLVFFIAFSPACVGQEEKPKSKGGQVLSDSKTGAFTGCYNLKLGRWWPWGFGQDNIFATPSSRIKLLPEQGTEGFERYGLVIREMTLGKSPSPFRRRFSYWQVESSDKIDLTWTTGFSGVTLELKKGKKDLRGWAHPFWDFPRPPRIARVKASKIACDAAQ